MSTSTDDPPSGVSVARSVRRPDEGPPNLGRLLYRERQRTATLQRVLTSRTGISQPNISACEQGRREPTWTVFVRLIEAMDRRLVVSTEPLESAADQIRRVISISSVVHEVLEVVGDRLYRFEDNAAAHILGLDLPLDFVHVSVLGDPNNLDELALRATGRFSLPSMASRSGSHRWRTSGCNLCCEPRRTASQAVVLTPTR